MRFLRDVLSRGLWPIAGLFALILLAGCDAAGNLTETVETVGERDLSGVAGPVDPTQLEPVVGVPRNLFGAANTVAALAFDLDAEERAAFLRGLDFFITEHTAEEGVGPVANQNRCLGCHTNTAENAAAPFQSGMVHRGVHRCGARLRPREADESGGRPARGNRGPAQSTPRPRRRRAPGSLDTHAGRAGGRGDPVRLVVLAVPRVRPGPVLSAAPHAIGPLQLRRTSCGT